MEYDIAPHVRGRGMIIARSIKNREKLVIEKLQSQLVSQLVNEWGFVVSKSTVSNICNRFKVKNE